MVRATLFALFFAAAGCTGAGAVPGVVESDIIGGTSDAADNAVVLLFMTVPGQAGGNICTGEVISPHVVLTAAHCTGGEDPTITNATYSVYVGADFNKATAAELLPVKEVHYNPAFSVQNLMGGNDVGVAILTNPIAATVRPLAMNRTPLDASYDGKQVRFVGFGLDNAAAQSGAGVKRTTTTTLADHTGLLLHFTDGLHETCNGDSGGPAFMNIGGQDVIVGLTSFGDVNCNDGGYDTRLDTMTAWVDTYVKQADPGFVPPTTSSGSTSGGNTSTPPASAGGTQAPPTSSATPMPPSSTGAGGVGASCVSDNDCQSRLCGLDNKGGHQCFAANANSGGIGCSLVVATGGSGGGAGLAVTLLFGLAVKLGRSRRRTRKQRSRGTQVEAPNHG